MCEKLTIKIGTMETINHEYYVSSEVANLLKEAGFDWECEHPYFNGVFDYDLYEPDNFLDTPYQIAAPTLDVAQRWLREVKKMYIEVQVFSDSNINDVRYGVNIENSRIATPELCNTYEEAQEAGIKKVLEIILEKGE